MALNNFTNITDTEILVTAADGTKTLVSAGGNADLAYGLAIRYAGLQLTSTLAVPLTTVTSAELGVTEAAAAAALAAGQDEGVIASAMIDFTGNQPLTGEYLIIGGDTYEFVTAGGAVTLDANIGVELSGVLLNTDIETLADAINGAIVSSTITDVATTGSALINGTEALLATAPGGDVLIIQNAVYRGGAALPGTQSIALDASNVGGAVWDVGNVNMTSLGGKAQRTVEESRIVLTWTTALAVTGIYTIRLPFTPVGFTFQVRSATGLDLTDTITDLFTISGNNIVITKDAAGNLGDTNIVTIVAWSA